jgi:hypothetical protein
MVLIMEPMRVPTLEGSFQVKNEKLLVHAGLDADIAHQLVLGGARLVFQDEIMLEEGKVWENGEVSIA